MFKKFRLISMVALMAATTGLLFASVSFDPPGNTVPVGGSITITNNGDSTVVAQATVNGTVVKTEAIAPGDSVTWPIPNDPSLIGLEVTITVYNLQGQVVATKTYTITLGEVEPGGTSGTSGQSQG